MKKSKTIRFFKSILCVAALLLAALTQVQANTFGYTNGNVLICFRKSPSGTTDLIVNAGPISYFTNLAPNTKVNINAYTGTQLGQVGTNNLAWSALAYFDNTASPAALRNTIFMTNPRYDLNTQTTPYYCDTYNAQGSTISKLITISAGAVNNANYSGLNSSTAVLESESYNLNNAAVSYYIGLGNTLDFRQTFQAAPDQYTPANFTTGGVPVRSDFYWLAPATGEPDAKFLGYFEFSTNGMMSYTAYPSTVVATPVILSFTRTGTTNNVTFTTGSSGTYTLCGINSLTSGTAMTNWPAISSVSGNGSSQSLSDVTAAGNKFYVITAQ
jgi:hypothetical protein